MPTMERNALLKTLRQFGGQDNVIVVPRSFVKFAGSLEAGMLLSQLLYWSDKSKTPNRVYKTDAEWADELSISKYAVRQARADLEKMEIISTEVHRANGQPTVHYYLKEDVLVEKWELWIRKNEIAKPQERNCETANSLTETTTETTTEKEIKPSAKAENSAEDFDSQECAEKEKELQAKANAEFDAMPSASAGLPSRELTAAVADPHAELTELAEEIAAALDADLAHLPQAKTVARKMIVAYGDKARATLRAYLKNPKNREFVRDKNPNALVGLLQADYARSFKHNRHGGVLRTGVAYGG